MSPLEDAIRASYLNPEKNSTVNKAYLEFTKANFWVPVLQNTEEPEVLRLECDNNIFLPVFSEKNYFHNWADEIKDSIEILHLTGVDLLKGVGDDVIIALNINTPYYKEFNPGEIARMRSIIIKIFKK